MTQIARKLVSLLCLVNMANVLGQSWQTLNNLPTPRRYNDVFFVAPQTGWVVNGAGQIYRTDNGGGSWQNQFDDVRAHFRSIGFFDAQNGWAGNVGPGEFGATDSTTLYHTNNGGQTWMRFEGFIGPKPRGLCGMHVVNDSVICAVGRVRGPAFFTRTTDRGKTWHAQDMSAYAAGLIDVFFFHPDTGIAVGLTNVTHDNSSGVVLYTSDGGNTWVKRFITTRAGEWCWKISFPSRRVGYVSLQRNSLSPIYILKTTDGGETWQEKLFKSDHYYVQGLGFIDEQTGWIGGNSMYTSYQTTDGGETWAPAGFGANLNRLRFIGDTLGYGVGRTVYKYKRPPISVTSPLVESPSAFVLHQNYPNPFATQTQLTGTKIEFELTRSTEVTIKIYDVAGREIEQLLHATRGPGKHVITWEGYDREGNRVSAGVYFYTLHAGNVRVSKKLVITQ